MSDKKENPVGISQLVIYFILIIFGILLWANAFDTSWATDSEPFIVSCCPPIIIFGTLIFWASRYSKK